jgi:hypothetical protein
MVNFKLKRFIVVKFEKFITLGNIFLIRLSGKILRKLLIKRLNFFLAPTFKNSII